MLTEQTANIALSILAGGRLGPSDAKTLHDTAGSALCVIENSKDICAVIPDATDRLREIMSTKTEESLRRAEEEQQWAADNNVNIITIDDARYPDRLRQCHDAPLTLYMRGNANLNPACSLAVVGTRKCTAYGKDVIDHIIRDLKMLCPSVQIVSGLAYGVDICAHRASLHEGVPTIGVVAHGHDTLYPALHRTEANQMLENDGAVLTEYVHGIRPVAGNFLQRNRIVAGMTDATLVVESASHGGSLVTARLAQDYGREVFAVPGHVTAEYSKGCNNLIRDQKAQLITSAQDIVNAMDWQRLAKLEQARSVGIERTLFNDLSGDEQKIADALRQHGDKPIGELSLITAIPVSVLQSMLFSLEMRGVIRAVPGNAYHFIG